MPVLPSTAMTTDTLNLIKNDTPFLALYTTNPTASDTGTEVSGGGYERKAVAFGTITGGSMSNTSVITFTNLATANISHYGIKNASTSGNLKVYGALNSTAAVVTGDQVQFPVGSITINLSGS